MYTNGYSGNYSRSIDLDIETYFHNSKYIMTEPRISYRTSSYMSMFDFGIKRPNYFGFSGLERYIIGLAVKMQITGEYLANKGRYNSLDNYNSIFITSAEIHDPVIFLREERKPGGIISNLSHELMKAIRHIFRLTMGFEMPEHISISMFDETGLEREHGKHSRFWNKDIQGFAINRMHLNGISMVAVKENPLDMLLLTIGHEIGHCLSVSKEDAKLEEAKAFAFELAWMETIHRFNILGLKEMMNISLLNPSMNGLHNVALDFVRKNLWENTPKELFKKIVDDSISFA